MTDFQKLSESELLAVIERAETELKNKQANKRKEVLAQIKDLAASIDVHVEIHEVNKKSARMASKIPIKYRHPEDPEKTWTGRGMAPKWIKTLLDNGRDRSEFEV